MAEDGGLVQRDVITFAGLRRYTLIAHIYAVDIEANDASGIPNGIQLWQNYPNPFNPSTSIQFDLPSLGEMSLIIYDLQGREVKVLYTGEHPAGFHSASWNGNDGQGNSVAAGIYIYRLQGPGFSQSRKMVYLK